MEQLQRTFEARLAADAARATSELQHQQALSQQLATLKDETLTATKATADREVCCQPSSGCDVCAGWASARTPSSFVSTDGIMRYGRLRMPLLQIGRLKALLQEERERLSLALQQVDKISCEKYGLTPSCVPVPLPWAVLGV